eukprot:m.160592 g.160592  ORF g.160592 m.160592 type:complete len:236 (-) comp13385_c0_seq1:3385-4092(-)
MELERNQSINQSTTTTMPTLFQVLSHYIAAQAFDSDKVSKNSKSTAQQLQGASKQLGRVATATKKRSGAQRASQKSMLANANDEELMFTLKTDDGEIKVGPVTFVYILFKTFDDDDDDKISISEFQKLYAALGEERSVSQIVEMVLCYDDDNDGMIDFGEFIMSMVLEGYRDVFVALDTDGNGRLDKSEFCKGMEALGFGGELVGLFHAVDTDSSGTIDYKEFARFIFALKQSKK